MGAMKQWDKGKTTAKGLGWRWQQLRPRILARDSGLCQVCKAKGATTAATEVDHILGRAKGGTDDDDNLQSICSDCHKAKTAADNGHRLKHQIGADGWPVAP